MGNTDTGRGEIESEVFKPHSEDPRIIGFLYPILLETTPNILSTEKKKYLFSIFFLVLHIVAVTNVLQSW